MGRELKKRGYLVRLNTNGQGNIINGRDITPEIAEGVDEVNVSLNAPTADEYYDICRPVFGEDAFDALIDFAKKCKERGLAVTFSIVDCIGEKKVEECKKLADKVGIKLRVRKYIDEH